MFWKAALTGVLMLTATQASAGCTSADLDVKINTDRRYPSGLPGQAYFEFMTECASSASADVLQRARDWMADNPVNNYYQRYQDQQRAADYAATQQALRDQQIMRENRQRTDKWILDMERECRSGGYCHPDSRAIIEDYRKRHPDLPVQQVDSQGSRDLGGVSVDIRAKQVAPSTDMSDIRKQVLTLSR